MLRALRRRRRHFSPSRPETADLIAGLSVAVVLIPQSMAYAELAGLPAQVGLFAAAVPPLLAAPFVSSPYLQTGPVALTALLTFGALEGQAPAFSETYVELAILLALLVGVVRVALGMLRLGNLAYLLSGPVLTGFTTGAAVLIVASQTPSLLGSDPDVSGVMQRAGAAIAEPGSWSIEPVVFAMATSALMIGGRRLHRFFPGVFVAVVIAILFSEFVGYDGSTIGDIPGGFVALHPDFPWGSMADLLIPAVAIAIVGFAEPASIARSFAASERTPWDANREMIGQGVANLASAFSGGMPVGGSFSRSALSRMAGGKTRWTGAVVGIIVLLALPLAPLAEALPRAVLASIVVTSVIKLVDLRSIWRLFGQSVAQGWVALGTLIATLGFSPRVERGVFVGVALSVAVHLYRELNVVAEQHVQGSTLTIVPKGVLWFATVPRLEHMCRAKLAEDPAIDHIVIDLAGVGRLDYTGAATLQQSIEAFRDAGVSVRVINVRPGAQRAAGIHFDDAQRSASPDGDGTTRPGGGG